MRRALVIGGSIGGLTTALLLRAQGWSVTICERSQQPLSGRGAGIITHPELWAVLRACGIEAGDRQGVAVRDRILFAPDGSVVARLDFPQITATWGRVFGLLRRAWGEGDYRLGHELAAVSQTDDGVRATFADGSSIEAALLVGADGFRSNVRQACLGALPLRYAGYVGWRGMVAEAEVDPALFAQFFFGLPPGEHFVGYPVPGAEDDLRPGHRRCNFVWYRPTDEARALPDVLTDSSGHTHALSIPPPLIRPEFVARLRADALLLLAPRLAAVLHAARSPFVQPIYDFETPAMAIGRVALIGDAAFVARPHLGAGVTKAAEDAMALVTALAGAEVPEALAAYEASRLPAGRRLVQRARHLGAYMQADQASAEERAAAARHASGDAVLAETATLVF